MEVQPCKPWLYSASIVYSFIIFFKFYTSRNACKIWYLISSNSLIVHRLPGYRFACIRVEGNFFLLFYLHSRNICITLNTNFHWISQNICYTIYLFTYYLFIYTIYKWNMNQQERQGFYTLSVSNPFNRWYTSWVYWCRINE